MTLRQQQVLDLLMQFPCEYVRCGTNGVQAIRCNTDKLIARKLGMAERTVKKVLHLIAKRYGIKGNRFIVRQRIVYLEAIRRGLIPIVHASVWTKAGKP